MSNTTFHWAEEYYQRGYSVIPLHGKLPPAGFRWKRYQQRRATLDEIRAWFGSNSRHEYNVGIVTGEVSGLVVVDCDTQEDARWWAESFPSTAMVAFTGRGGAHMYYREAPTASVRNRTRVLGRKIDVRASGGYVAAPPSVHPQTGRIYRFRPWDYFAADEIPTFDPQWLAPRKPTPAATTAPGAPRVNALIRNGPAYIWHIRAVSGQDGHASTYRAAACLRDAGMTPEEVLAALTVWNQTNCKPPWTAAQLLHKVEDVFKVASL